MGIDLPSKKRKSGRKTCVSHNPYMKLLAELFKFLHRRTGTDFSKTIFKRVITSRRNRHPVNTSKLVHLMSKSPEKTAVVVATVVNDEKQISMPKMTVAALR